MLRHLKTLNVHDDPQKVAFSIGQIVSAHDDHKLRLWNVETGEQIGNDWVGHTDTITTLSFSPGGDKVVSGDKKGKVILWNVNRGTPLQIIPAGTAMIYSAIFQNEEQIEVVIFQKYWERAFRDGHPVKNCSVSTWDTSGTKLVEIQEQRSQFIGNTSTSPTGGLCITTLPERDPEYPNRYSRKCNLTLSDARSRKILDSQPAVEYASATTFSSTGQYVAIAYSSNNSIEVWSISGNTSSIKAAR